MGRFEKELRMQQDVYSGYLKLNGEEHDYTLQAALNYGDSLRRQLRFEEAKALMRKTIPVARRVLGVDNILTLTMRWNYAKALYEDPDATPDDLREAVTMLEDTVQIARRVLGGAHPTVSGIDVCLRDARAALHARETGGPGETPGETPGSFQRASEDKLRTRRFVSVAGRFRRSAAEKPPPPGSGTPTPEAPSPPARSV